MSKLALILCLFTSLAWSQEATEQAQDILLMDPYLSTKYQRGAYLLYDCFDSHWVCTAKAEFDICQDARGIASKNKDDVMPCIPIKPFVNEKKCQQIQARLVSRKYGVRNCRSEELKDIDRIF